MTVINNKNISGITSINAQSNSLELFNSAGVSLLDLNTNSVTFPGNISGVGGTLTSNGDIQFDSKDKSIKFVAGNTSISSIECNSNNGPRASIDFVADGTVQVTDIVFKTSETSITSAERMRIKRSTGNIGIGTDTPAETLSVAGNVRVENSADASQYLNISYQGIDFQNTGAGSSTTAASHLLDDYEEGTFDPFATVAGNFTGEAIRSCRYTRIGNLVHCDLRVTWSSTTGTDPLRFDLPFAQAGSAGFAGNTGIVFYSGTSIDASAISAHVPKDSTRVSFYQTDGGSFNGVFLNDVNSGYDWIVSFSYHAA